MMMEEEIKSQSQKEAATAAQVQSLREKFAKVASLKIGTQGKEVWWIPQEVATWSVPLM